MRNTYVPYATTNTYAELAAETIIAVCVLLHLCTNSRHDIRAVQVGLHAFDDIVAQIAVYTIFADIIRILATLLVWLDHVMVAFDDSWHTTKHVLWGVAIFNKLGACWILVIHLVAYFLIQCRSIRVSTCVLWVILVLDEWICQAIAHQKWL